MSAPSPQALPRRGLSRRPLPPGLKTAALALAGGGLLFLSSLPALAAAAAASAVLSLVRLGPGGLRAAFPPVILVMLLGVGLAAGYATTARDAAIALLRLSTLIVLAHLYAATTQPSDLQDVVARVARPLERLPFVSAATLGLTFALALTSIPRIRSHLNALREAQASRGLRLGPHRLILPLMVRIVRDAGEIADAIEARGWSGRRDADRQEPGKDID